MKLVKIILRPEKKFIVKDVLADIGCHGITSRECSGFAESKKTIREVYGGRVYEQRDDSVKREEIEFVVPDNKVKEVLERVQLAATTDEGADGRIYVSALEESVHVHNGKEHSGDRNESDLDL